MPNPIIGRIVSNRWAPNRSEPIPPVPEKYAGDNLPYRGIEQHGVSVDENWRDPADDMAIGPDGRLVDVYEHDAPEPEPVPVRIVGTDSAERPAFRTMRMHLDTNAGPTLLLGKDSRRQSVFIRNDTATKTLVVGYSPDSLNMFGFPVAQANFSGLTIGRGSAEEIYVMSQDGSAIDISVMWETSIG